MIQTPTVIVDFIAPPGWPTFVTGALAVLVTFLVFYTTRKHQKWLRSQRDPRPIFLDGEYQCDSASGTCTFKMLMGNSGDVPIFVESVGVRKTVGGGEKVTLFPRGRITVTPRGSATVDPMNAIESKSASFVNVTVKDKEEEQEVFYWVDVYSSPPTSFKPTGFLLSMFMGKLVDEEKRARASLEEWWIETKRKVLAPLRLWKS